MTRLFATAIVLAVSLSGCNSGGEPQTESAASEDAVPAAPDGPGVMVDSNGLRLSANSDAPSAAYLVLRGDGQPMALTGISSPEASRVEMHESIRENGMATMRALERIDIPANGEVVMRPGGIHLMIFDVSAAARAAREMPLDLTFADGTRVRVTASVADLTARESGAPAEDHSGH